MGGTCFKTANSGTFADDLSDMSTTEKGHALEMDFRCGAILAGLQESRETSKKVKCTAETLENG